MPFRTSGVNCSCATADPGGSSTGPVLVRMKTPLLNAASLDHAQLTYPSIELTNTVRLSVYLNHLRAAATSETSYRAAQSPIISKSGVSLGAICFRKSSSRISNHAANSFASRSTAIFVRPSTSASLEWMPFGYFFLCRR